MAASGNLLMRRLTQVRVLGQLIFSHLSYFIFILPSSPAANTFATHTTGTPRQLPWIAASAAAGGVPRSGGAAQSARMEVCGTSAATHLSATACDQSRVPLWLEATDSGRQHLGLFCGTHQESHGARLSAHHIPRPTTHYRCATHSGRHLGAGEGSACGCGTCA